jgi:hypothetical protein
MYMASRNQFDEDLQRRKFRQFRIYGRFKSYVYGPHNQFDENITTPEDSANKNRREFKVLHTASHKRSYFCEELRRQKAP